MMSEIKTQEEKEVQLPSQEEIQAGMMAEFNMIKLRGAAIALKKEKLEILKNILYDEDINLNAEISAKIQIQMDEIIASFLVINV